MNPDLIGQTWDSITDKHRDLVVAFYDRFFERFPHYREFFPKSMDHQMRKMVNTMAMVARLADSCDMVEPHMTRLGEAHRDYHLEKEDLDNFKSVFLEVLAEYLGDRWEGECCDSWTEAFDKIIEPYMLKGMH
jgi:hemoglobin-like flavoprotein